MEFKLITKDKFSKARAGVINTDHGMIQTPIFMPVGTAGTVKAVHQHELEDVIQAQVILSNTYHLYLRPGLATIKNAGGLHSFSAWNLPILTDSGGYQVYSLADTRSITEEGVTFRSHIDGSKHVFTPENVIAMQRIIGSDIMMAFDECVAYPCSYVYAKKSLERTDRWLKRCKQALYTTSPIYGHRQSLFAIVQGSTYKDLREQSAETIAALSCDGNAIGGLSVGEPPADRYAVTELVCTILPEHRPRYLMGVGTPMDILESIALGVDMFDCVMPTRNARNGLLFTQQGIINIRNEKWKNDFSAIDRDSDLWVDKNHSKAYLRHLICSREILGAQIATLHNLYFYHWLLKTARERIILGEFYHWKQSITPLLGQRL